MERIEFTGTNGTLIGHKWEIENPKYVLFLVTGMAEHSGRYDEFANYLNQNGISVFCLDHYGQGENEELGNPVEGYFFKEIEIFKEYVIYLKETYNKDVFMFAHSMGSFITQAFIEKYSSLIKKVIICGSNGRNPLVKVGKFVANIYVNKKNENQKATFLHSLSLGAYEKSVKNRKDVNDWISFNEDNVKKYNDDPLSGVKCTNKFFKNFFNGLATIQKGKNVKMISKDLEIFIIGGDSDPVGNNGKGLRSLFKLYSKYDLNVVLKIYPNMRHEILNENEKHIVYSDILDFLMR